MIKIADKIQNKISNIRKTDVLQKFEENIVVKKQIYAQILVSFDEILSQFGNVVHVY